ncbi:ankyrin repeat-containing protein [Anaeramoeba flamelloides]|uniref:Ankyrin repeat-containing protein n=1 Tax=Anaeramoeba flamelloides TaxID=1746091 RepID=A0AAV7YJK0_9EUKA|nr:ankyrin repeat-containing protein [Anaeramoeba flamelloides]
MNTILHVYCRNKNQDLEILKFFIEKGVDIKARNRFNKSAFFFLCEKKSLETDIIYFFLDNGIDLNERDRRSNAIFHLICKNKTPSLEIIKLLIKKGINIHEKDKNGNTGLHYLCENAEQSLDLIKYLIEKGAKINERNKDGNDCFQLFCKREKNDITILKFFLNHDVNFNNHNVFGKNPLSDLFSNKSHPAEFFDFFLQYHLKNYATNNDNKNKKNNEKKSVFSIIFVFSKLCENRPVHLEIIKKFYTQVISKNHGGWKEGFFTLCRNTDINVQTIKYFVNHNIKINDCDYRGNTGFHFSCKNYKPNLQVFNYFLENGANINLKVRGGSTCFHYICQNEHINLDVIKFFLKKGADIYSEDNMRNTPLLYLLQNKNHRHLINFIFKNYYNINYQDAFGESLLHLYFINSKCEALDLFFYNGANFNLINNENESIYDYAKENYYYNHFVKDDIKQMILLNNNCLRNDLKNFFLHERKFTDFEIKGIKFHKAFLENSLEKPIEEITKILEKYPEEYILQFLKLIYFNEIVEIKNHDSNNTLNKNQNENENELENNNKDKNENRNEIVNEKEKEKENDKKNENGNENGNEDEDEDGDGDGNENENGNGNEDEEGDEDEDEDEDKNGNRYKKQKDKEIKNKNKVLFQILNHLGIKHKLFALHWKKSLKRLYRDENSKNFTIILTNKQEIKVHKFILECRSGLFRLLFSNINDPNINQINDYSEHSLEAMGILLEYLYTEKISKRDINLDVLDELSDMGDYYQLDPKCTFNLLVEDINKNLQKK